MQKSSSPCKNQVFSKKDAFSGNFACDNYVFSKKDAISCHFLYENQVFFHENWSFTTTKSISLYKKVVFFNFSHQVRSFGTTICMLANSIFAFISVKMFPILMHELCLSGVSWICAGVCFYGILFSIFILEETKGKKLNESVPKISPTSA